MRVLARPPQAPRRRAFRPQRSCTRCAVDRVYTSQRALQLPLKEHALHSSKHYLSHTERIVVLSFPDSERRTRLDETTWRIQLLPLRLLWLSNVGVCCTLKTWCDEAGVLRMAGRELQLHGLPPELVGSLMLRVEGSLQSVIGSRGSELQGAVSLRLSAAVPELLAFSPGFDSVVNTINDEVLQRIEESLRRELTLDYLRWCREEEAIRRRREAAALEGRS
jgi:hypothetical protein